MIQMKLVDHVIPVTTLHLVVALRVHLHLLLWLVTGGLMVSAKMARADL